ncbi:MAG: AAA family ATPase, partial [Bacteroidales bacterium]|nr:AAA family ATPase [Bacteroidales bacterium]
WSNRVYYDGTWEANLFQFYIKVYNKLSAALPKPFALRNGQRIDDTPTRVALREAFINALIHSDYSINASLNIEQHKDFLKFSNPGSLLITIAQYYQGGESVCRNKYLQQMFMLLGAAEKAGSGADKILQGWKEANYRSPKLEESVQPNKVILTMPLVNLLSEDILSFLKENYGNKFNDLSHDELITLATCYSEGQVTNYRLQITIDKHSADITKLLKGLCDNNLLISYGVGRGTKYKINEDYLSYNTNNTSNSTSNDTSNGTSRRTRKSIDTLRIEILEACSNYVSLEEIAQKVGKSISHLKGQIIPQMLQENLLERQFPNAPRHPHQKYRTVKK